MPKIDLHFSWKWKADFYRWDSFEMPLHEGCASYGLP